MKWTWICHTTLLVFVLNFSWSNSHRLWNLGLFGLKSKWWIINTLKPVQWGRDMESPDFHHSRLGTRVPSARYVPPVIMTKTIHEPPLVCDGYTTEYVTQWHNEWHLDRNYMYRKNVSLRIVSIKFFSKFVGRIILHVPGQRNRLSPSTWHGSEHTNTETSTKCTFQSQSQSVETKSLYQ